MSSPGFREIQLTGKQVVFLFIAGVVAVVSVFLLGVSFGKNVGGPDPALVPGVELADGMPPPALPPATTPEPGELEFHKTLQGRGTEPPPAPATPPAGNPPDPAPTPTPTTTPASPPARPAAMPTPTPTTSPAAPARGSYLQVNSFGSRENAQRQVSELKKLGITSAIFNVPGATPFKVWVGPFATDAEVSAMRARLQKEGYKPSLVTR
jgi:cell division septation protein DedD